MCPEKHHLRKGIIATKCVMTFVIHPIHELECEGGSKGGTEIVSKCQLARREEKAGGISLIDPRLRQKVT